MSDSWIDRLAKSVASRDLNQSGPTPTEEPIPLSRRSLLGRAGAATAGALAYLIPGMSPAHAAGCSGSKKKCNGRCVNTRTSERHCGACNHRCDNGEVCSRGKCCKKGTTNCNGKCVDLKKNEDNCGRCGRKCGNNETCSKGKCCPQGQKNCGGTCVNAQTDEQNCGTCGNSCSGDDVCVSGTCAPATCTDGIKNHGETDVDCGGPNCPDCQAGGDCLQGSDCQSGVCTGGICQGATCTDLVKNGDETDVDCGGPDCPDCANDKNCLVGTDCQSGVCDNGVCKFCAPGSQRSCYTGPQGTQNVGVCQGGTETCNGGGTAYGACQGEVTPSSEVCDNLDNDCDGLTDNDPSDVGQACCGDTGPNSACCNSGFTTCQNGSQVCSGQPCSPGTSCCTQGCVDLSSDVNNCGFCGNPCGQGETCCTQGCVDLSSDVNNCGFCGNPCAQGETCSGGTCLG